MDKDQLNLVGSLEEEALKRKQRLQSLKNKRKLNGGENEENHEEKKTGNLPKPIFRSYIPSDESLKEQKLAKAEPERVEDHIQDQLKALKDKNIVDEINIANLAPRKADWDLKRNIEKDLQKLEKRTEKAIADLIRERIKNEQQHIIT